MSELRAAKEEATALVANPQAGRKAGVDAATQTEEEVTPTGVSTVPVAIQEAEGAHTEVDTSPPGHEESEEEEDVWIWSTTTENGGVLAHAGQAQCQASS